MSKIVGTQGKLHVRKLIAKKMQGKSKMSKFENEIDKETVEQMAKLAHLKLSGSQIDEYTQQMSVVLKYFDEISKVDTTDVEPMVTPALVESFWREDEVRSDFSVEEIMANAPLRVGNLFKVPQVV